MLRRAHRGLEVTASVSRGTGTPGYLCKTGWEGERELATGTLQEVNGVVVERMKGTVHVFFLHPAAETLLLLLTAAAEAIARVVVEMAGGLRDLSPRAKAVLLATHLNTHL